MNRDQKAAVVDRVADEIQGAEAVFAVDYRGLSVKQAVDLRTSLRDAGASFRIVKNTLTERAADKAGAEFLKELLDGPTALTFVQGDVALAAKALATFRRQAGILEFKGGQMAGEVLTIEQIESLARLPALEVLHGQLVGTIAAPLTGLVRGLASMISGLAIQLKQIEEQGLVGGGAAAEDAAGSGQEAAEAAPADEVPAPEPTDTGDTEPSEAPGDPVAEAEAVEAEAPAEESETETPSEGEETEEKEG